MMKLSQPMLKMIIKILILMMLFVIMFMISTFLYSAKYWPDVYNYINANITIKRIPTISELELTVIEVDYTTEQPYTSTDGDYIEVSTVDDFDIDEFMKDEIEFTKKVKRHIEVEQLKDYIELPPRPIFVDYIFIEEPMRQETDASKKAADDDNIPEETDKNILKTSVTGIVIEDEQPKTTVSEEPAVRKKYYTVQPEKTKESRRSIDEGLYTTEISNNELEHTTTIEGYLVGDNERDEEVTEEPIVITTKSNENELLDDEDDSQLMKDSVDVSNLSTRSSDDVELVTRKPWKMQMLPDPVCHGDWSCKEFTRTVYPWVVSIFVTNDGADSQFSYYCDGALLTEKVIVTGARCMFANNSAWDSENVLVFLGKVNLQAFGGKEKVHKVKTLILHPNFTTGASGRVMNDIALLVLEVPVEFKDNIQSACIHQENSLLVAAATAWGANGLLMPIFFNNQRGDHCYDMDENVFCVTYGNDVALCPSFGGVFVSKQTERWCLTGIYYGDPAERGICFNKNVFYTSLYNHLKWIDDTIGMIKKAYL
ncbi:unnamed protein product [Spodoptera littoralis]|uniref:Peptidase S1 domain-containing protein n=1 Tax=Spodoptera littoralis TaxID=7109 RepID=A0A9P0I973_SPOLI|nr:unnamed protein product [Spodoptera littoralis]CAH1641710.1 unnamed protein product [Spodoptera littoralis]